MRVPVKNMLRQEHFLMMAIASGIWNPIEVEQGFRVAKISGFA
jgi:hypothetical protein